MRVTSGTACTTCMLRVARVRASRSAGRGLAGAVRIPPTIFTCGGIGCGGSIAKSEHTSSSASRDPLIGSTPNFRLRACEHLAHCSGSAKAHEAGVLHLDITEPAKNSCVWQVVFHQSRLDAHALP